MTEEQRERWNKNRRERYANSPEVRERHRVSQEKWVAKKLKDNPNYLSDYMKNWRKKKQSLFQQITASPEVLTKELVYMVEYVCGFITVRKWTSNLIDYEYANFEEAFAATLERLKEVEK